MPNDIDLFFIDADHCYEGVYNDTKNVFSIRNKESIVIWHDFKRAHEYRVEVINAVRDALNENFKNVYVTNNNICGIYLPENKQQALTYKKCTYEINSPLYTYDVSMGAGIKYL